MPTQPLILNQPQTLQIPYSVAPVQPQEMSAPSLLTSVVHPGLVSPQVHGAATLPSVVVHQQIEPQGESKEKPHSQAGVGGVDPMTRAGVPGNIGTTSLQASQVAGSSPNDGRAVGKSDKVETLAAGRIRSALEHRRLVYSNLATFEQLLLYHQQWLQRAPEARERAVRPDAATLDARGEDLPLEQLHALATQSLVKSMAQKAAAAMNDDRGLLNLDRYVYWHNTRAPPAEWGDVLPALIALHEVKVGFMVAELGLAPKGGATKGFTWVTGFVEEKWAHYVRYALDRKLCCSTYLLEPAQWLRGERTDRAESSERLLAVSETTGRQTGRFPSERSATTLRSFLHPINPALLEHVAGRCLQLTVVDHNAGDRTSILKLLWEVLRDRHKPNSVASRSKGTRHYVPAVQGIRIERDEAQRAEYVRGIHARDPTTPVKLLLEMPLNELRVAFWTHTPLPTKP
jgi:hypothetical protein